MDRTDRLDKGGASQRLLHGHTGRVSAVWRSDKVLGQTRLIPDNRWHIFEVSFGGRTLCNGILLVEPDMKLPDHHFTSKLMSVTQPVASDSHLRLCALKILCILSLSPRHEVSMAPDMLPKCLFASLLRGK